MCRCHLESVLRAIGYDEGKTEFAKPSEDLYFWSVRSLAAGSLNLEKKVRQGAVDVTANLTTRPFDGDLQRSLSLLNICAKKASNEFS